MKKAKKENCIGKRTGGSIEGVKILVSMESKSF